MEGRSESFEDSHIAKRVQNGTAADHNEEVSKDDEERVIEAKEVKSGRENGEDGKKTKVSTKNDEAKEGDLKEINELMDTSEAKKEDVKKMDEIDVIDVRKEEEIEDGELAKEDESKAVVVEVIKDGELAKEDEPKAVVEVIKDGELAKQGEPKAVVEEEKVIPEGDKERVVKIDQNPQFVEENGESNKNDGKKEADLQGEDVSSCNLDASSLSFKEESNLFSDLKDNEKKALLEFRSKVEEAINGNQLLKTKEMEKPRQNEGREDVRDDGGKANSSTEEAEKEREKNGQEEKNDVITEAEDDKMQEDIEGKNGDHIAEDIKLWGVPLLPSKGGKATDVVLLKFLMAREFKVVEAFEMLKNTLQWRNDNKMDSILEEDLGNEFNSTANINGTDRQGRPVCYNVFGVLGNDKMYNKTIGTEDNRGKFVRWRLQLMEEGIKKLDFSDASCMLQISDLKNTPGPSKKEVRLILKQVISLLQDNYPEFVANHIFINVPLWYYALATILSPFLTQRTKSKFVYARPAKVTETLLKYIDAEEIPVCYGGLKRDKDSDFSAHDHTEEILVKASATETIEIPVPEVGSVVMWDLVVLGWEVKYKEEFVPNDDKSYSIIVQKERKMGVQDGSVRNSFMNKEPGKIALIIDNALKSKKRAFYRYKIKNSSSS